MQNARPAWKHRHAPPPRLMVPPDADRLAREAMRAACGLCAAELRAALSRLARALAAADAPTALSEARAMRDLAAEFRLHGLIAPLLQIERALRCSSRARATSAPLAALEGRLERELAALPA